MVGRHELCKILPLWLKVEDGEEKNGVISFSPMGKPHSDLSPPGHADAQPIAAHHLSLSCCKLRAVLLSCAYLLHAARRGAELFQLPPNTLRYRTRPLHRLLGAFHSGLFRDLRSRHHGLKQLSSDAGDCAGFRTQNDNEQNCW